MTNKQIHRLLATILREAQLKGVPRRSTQQAKALNRLKYIIGRKELATLRPLAEKLTQLLRDGHSEDFKSELELAVIEST